MTGTPCRIDLHIHTVVSDGTDTPEQLLEKIRTSGIEVFSVTDHDAVSSREMFGGLIKDGDPVFITGAEFSCRDEQGKYHILGYGFDPASDAMTSLVLRGHGLRMKKVLARLDHLKNEFGFTFPKEELDRLLALDNPGKPHIGNLMVKYGYAKTKEQAITDFIDRVRFKTEYLRPEEAISGIISGGGIPVLAHLFYGSGDELIVGQDAAERVRRLVSFGLGGIEAFYSGFSDKLCSEALDLAEGYGLYVTCGSDYHGKNKLVSLGDTGLDRVNVFPDGLKRFLEKFKK